MKRIAPSIAVLLLLIATAAISIWRLDPPGRDDSTDGFETDRALTHLREIAREPHPMGSAANERVRRYLIEQLTMLGLEVRSPEQTVTIRRGGRAIDYTPKNVLARLPDTGERTGPGQAVMLSAHYDSVEEGPGAGDDGAAVAALLEVARVLAAGPDLDRDVIFLITDGEEVDLLGARAFVTHDEWKAEPGVVFNFESRGVSGPSIMFETSPGNAWLIDAYADVAPHPVTTSLSGDVYDRMPNDTDFTIFRQAGIEGLNFAFIGSDEHYHQPTDNLEHLDARSLRHHGQQALALARRFANREVSFAAPAGRSAIYFDVLGVMVLHYPMSLAPWIAGITCIWLMAIAVRGWRRGRPRRRGMSAGIVTPIVIVAVVVGGCLALAEVFGDAGRQGRTSEVLYLMIGGAMMVPAMIAIRVSRWIGSLWLAAGTCALWIAMGCVAVVVAPGGSYLFHLPSVLFLAALTVGPRASIARSVLLLSGCVLATILIIPTTLLAGQALSVFGAPYVMALPALIGCVAGAICANGHATPVRSMSTDEANALSAGLS